MSLWSLSQPLREIKRAIFLSVAFCLSNRSTNPIPNSLDKRFSCLKCSFTSMWFQLALQEHILDHYCSAQLLFGKGHAHKKLHNKPNPWEHSSVPLLWGKSTVPSFHIFILLLSSTIPAQTLPFHTHLLHLWFKLVKLVLVWQRLLQGIIILDDFMCLD